MQETVVLKFKCPLAWYDVCMGPVLQQTHRIWQDSKCKQDAIRSTFLIIFSLKIYHKWINKNAYIINLSNKYHTWFLTICYDVGQFSTCYVRIPQGNTKYIDANK